MLSNNACIFRIVIKKKKKRRRREMKENETAIKFLFQTVILATVRTVCKL